MNQLLKDIQEVKEKAKELHITAVTTSKGRELLLEVYGELNRAERKIIKAIEEAEHGV